MEVAERFADGLAGNDKMPVPWPFVCDYSKRPSEPIDWARLTTYGAGTDAAIIFAHYATNSIWSYDPAKPDAFYAAEAVAWDVAGAAKNATDAKTWVKRWNTVKADEFKAQCCLLRDIIGNPFGPITIDRSCLTPTIKALTQKIYDNHAFDQMPTLADELEKVGCASNDIFGHCRGPGPHVRGCWVVDWVLGKGTAMTEAEWLASGEAYRPLLQVREFASIRKLRLVAAAFARWLQELPGFKDARPCADLIEEMADKPKPYSELEDRLHSLPGSSWALSHTVVGDASVGKNLSKLVFQAECSFVERSQAPEAVHRMMIGLLCEVFGNPFRPVTIDPSWLSPTVKALAKSIYTDRTFECLPSLADGLEKAGCDYAEVLNHFCGPGPHVKGCWALDLVLGKG